MQAGFLAGYGLHEGLSAAKGLELIDENHPVYAKAFDLSDTALNHKTGVVGIPLNVGIGWYSKPELVQFILQYALTFGLFAFWYVDRKRAAIN